MATVRAISSGAFAPLDRSKLSSCLVSHPNPMPMAKPPVPHNMMTSRLGCRHEADSQSQSRMTQHCFLVLINVSINVST